MTGNNPAVYSGNTTDNAAFNRVATGLLPGNRTTYGSGNNLASGAYTSGNTVGYAANTQYGTN